VREDEMDGVCGLQGEKRNMYWALVGIPEEKNIW